MAEARDAKTVGQKLREAAERLRTDPVKAELVTLRAEHDRLRDQLGTQEGLSTLLQMQRDRAESSVQALRQALEREYQRGVEAALVAVRRDIERHLYTNTKSKNRELMLNVVSRVAAALAPGEAAQQPAGSFGYCAICYHPLDRCSHCDAGEAAQETQK